MSHGWDTRTVIETAVSHRWARRIQYEPPILAAARNVLIKICFKLNLVVFYSIQSNAYQLTRCVRQQELVVHAECGVPTGGTLLSRLLCGCPTRGTF